MAEQLASKYIRLLEICTRTGDLQLVKRCLSSSPSILQNALPELFRIALQKTYDEAIKTRDSGKLIELATPTNWVLEDKYYEVLRTLAVVGLQEAIQVPDGPSLGKDLLPVLQDVLTAPEGESIVELGVGNPVSLVNGSVAIEIEGNKYFYGAEIYSMADSSVVLYEAQDEHERDVILERVNVGNLHKKSFPTLESWQAYLGSQERYNVSVRTSSIQFGGQVFTIYHIPEGFHSLSSVQQQFSGRKETDLFELAQNIGAAVELSAWRDGKFQSIGPVTVYADMTNSVRFVGLGLATLNPTYADPGTRLITENSNYAFQRFLSSLIGKMICDSVPKSNDSISTFILEQKLQIARPFRYIWDRFSNYIPEHRYISWDLASNDIRVAKSLYEAKAEDAGTREPLSDELFDLTAYLEFHMSITRRRPRLHPSFLRDYSYDLVTRYLEDLEEEVFLPESETLIRSPGFRRYKFCSRKQRNSLLFICRLLLDLAENYINVVTKDKRVERVSGIRVSLDLILAIVWLEAEAFIKATAIESATSNGENLTNSLAVIQENLLTLSDEDYDKTLVSEGIDAIPKVPLGNLISKGELQLLVDTIQRIILHPNHEATQLNLRSPAQLDIAAQILLGWLEFYPNGNDKGLRVGLLDNATVYEFVQSFRSLLQVLMGVDYRAFDQHLINDVKTELDRFILSCRGLSKTERKNSTLLRYNPLSRQGKARFRRGLWHWPEDLFFGNNMIGSSYWEKFPLNLLPGTIDVRLDHLSGKYLPIKVSTAPPFLLRANRGKLLSRLRRYLVPAQGDI